MNRRIKEVFTAFLVVLFCIFLSSNLVSASTDAINVTLDTIDNKDTSDATFNFTYTPVWNSSVTMNNCTLWGNFTGTWGSNESNQTALANNTINGIETNLSDDTYTWNVFCYGVGDYQDSASSNKSITIDTTKPKLYTNISNDSYYKTRTLTFSLNFTDANPDTVWVYNGTDNISYSSTNTSFSLNYASDGSQNVVLYANDTAGNLNSSSYSFTVDTVSPTVAINSVESPVQPKDNVTVNYSLQDTTSGLASASITLNDNNSNTISKNLTELSTGTYQLVDFNLSNLGGGSAAEGPFNLSFTATDNAGNSNSTTSSPAGNVDGTSPSMGYTSPTGNISDNRPIINISLSDAESSINTSTIGVTVSDADTSDGDDLTQIGTGSDVSYDSGTDTLSINLSSAGVTLADGNVDVEANASDAAGNTNSITETAVFTVDTTEPVPSIETANHTWFTTDTPSIDFNLTDNLDSTINYTLFVNGTLDQTGSESNATSASVTTSTLNDGAHSIILQAMDEAGNSANTSRYVINVDTIPPQFYDEKTEPSSGVDYVYGQSYQFNVTVNDSLNSIEEVIFEFDGTNYSYQAGEVNKSGEEYYYTLTNLAGGSYSYKWYANDSLDQWNSTTQATYEIKNGTLTGSLSSSNVNYPANLSVTFSEPSQGDGDVVYKLYRNGTLVNSSLKDGDMVTEDLAAGTYQYLVNSTGGANYSANSSINTTIVTISKASPSGSVTASNVTYPTDLTASSSMSNPGDGDVDYELYCDNYLMNSATGSAPSGTKDLPAGSYTCKLNTTSGTFANWTANSSIATNATEVSPGTLTGGVLGSNVTYPTSVDVGPTETNVGDGDTHYYLWRNGTQISDSLGSGSDLANDTSQLAARVYEYTFNATGGTNYTDNTSIASKLIYVDKGSQQLTLALNGSTSDSTYEKGTAVNITTWSNVTEDDITDKMDLWSNLTGSLQPLVDTRLGLNTIRNLTTTADLDLGSYLIHANVSETENYTAANNSLILTVEDTSDPIVSIYDYENASFKKAGDNLSLNVYVTDNDLLNAFNASVWFKNDTSFVLAGRIANSTQADSKQEWANGTVTVLSGLQEGTRTLKVNITDACGNSGNNTDYVVQVDDTSPSAEVSASEVTVNYGSQIDCSSNDSLSGVASTNLSVEKPGGDTVAADCNTEFSDTNQVGAYQVTYTVTDAVGNVKNVSTTFDAESSSGGGGSVTLPASHTYTWTEVEAGKEKVADMRDRELGLSEVIFVLRERSSDVSITVTRRESKPEGIEQDFKGLNDRYVELSTENIPDTNLQEASIQFTVNKTWIEDNNIDPEKIYLYRYVNDSWQQLQATIINETGAEYTYEAEVPGLSYFAIAGEEKGKQTCPYECCQAMEEYKDKACQEGYQCQDNSCVELTPEIANLTVSDFDVSPLEGEAPLDVSISVQIVNQGNKQGDEKFEVYQNNGEAFSRQVSLAAGETTEITKRVTLFEPGQHTIRVGDHQRTVDVRPKGTDKKGISLWLVAGLVVVAAVLLLVYYYWFRG